MEQELRAGRPITVRVPATSANLGPGYDCFGLALGRYDEITVTATTPGSLTVQVDGVGAGAVPTDETHLVVRSIRRALHAAGAPSTGLDLVCRNTIPHGGGQGSSAAAIVGGLVAGRALLTRPETLADDELLAVAADIEGHPDNVAPALLGGFTLAFTTTSGSVAAVRRDVHRDIRAVLFTAAGALSTRVSRSLLPATVPHADAAANAAAAALLVYALTDDPGWLLEATADRLHQQYRAPAMPATAAQVAALRSAGFAAVVSGAGPSVLVLCPDVDAATAAHRLAHSGFRAETVAVDTTGAVVSG